MEKCYESSLANQNSGKLSEEAALPGKAEVT